MMIAIYTIEEVRRQIAVLKRRCQSEGKEGTVGFVPTMGYLHEGHGSLLEAARRQCDIVVLSIFVNPTQFGPNEDFEKYPRDAERDLALADSKGADIVFMPDTQQMYPKPSLTSIKVHEVTERLCGASRPGHFDGVALVVSKLFHIIGPDYAYFGQKDAQQVAVIEQMVQDLNMPVTIVPCPIVREADGLALSSRNVYLGPEERKQALVLSQALDRSADWIRQELSADEVKTRIEEVIRTSPLAVIDYVEILQYPSLKPMEGSLQGQSRFMIALAVKFGRTRLIDNRMF